MKKERQFGLDLLRVLALILVIITHSVVLTGEYNYSELNFYWVVTMLAFYLSHSCVPLFLLLSGYLCSDKQPHSRYYCGIFRVVVPYLLIAIVDILYAWFVTADPSLKLSTGIYRILSFGAGGYDWYVEMYIGLFLLIPFMNVAYRAIPGQAWKLAMLGSLAFLTFLPDVFTSFGTQQVRANILPDYFNSCYPITYYLIGVWIKENEERLSNKIGMGLFLAGYLLPVALCIFRTVTEGVYAGGKTLNTFGCLTTASCAVGILILLSNIKRPPVFGKVVEELSRVSFEMYLFSYIADLIIFEKVQYQSHFFVTATINLVISYAMAKIIRLVSEPLISLCTRSWDCVERKVKMMM